MTEPRVVRANEVAERDLTRRIYRCRRCGHETVTVGSPLPGDMRCAIYERSRHGVPLRKCGGALVGRFAD